MTPRCGSGRSAPPTRPGASLLMPVPPRETWSPSVSTWRCGLNSSRTPIATGTPRLGERLIAAASIAATRLRSASSAYSSAYTRPRQFCTPAWRSLNEAGPLMAIKSCQALRRELDRIRTRALGSERFGQCRREAKRLIVMLVCAVQQTDRLGAHRLNLLDLCIQFGGKPVERARMGATAIAGAAAPPAASAGAAVGSALSRRSLDKFVA